MGAGTAIMIGVGLIGLGAVGYLAVRPSAPPTQTPGALPSTKGGNAAPGYGAGTETGVWDFLTGLAKVGGSAADKAINSAGGEKGNSGYGGSGALKAGSGNDQSFDDFWTGW